MTIYKKSVIPIFILTIFVLGTMTPVNAWGITPLKNEGIKNVQNYVDELNSHDLTQRYVLKPDYFHLSEYIACKNRLTGEIFWVDELDLSLDVAYYPLLDKDKKLIKGDQVTVFLQKTNDYRYSDAAVYISKTGKVLTGLKNDNYFDGLKYGDIERKELKKTELELNKSNNKLLEINIELNRLKTVPSPVKTLKTKTYKQMVNKKTSKTSKTLIKSHSKLSIKSITIKTLQKKQTNLTTKIKNLQTEKTNLTTKIKNLQTEKTNLTTKIKTLQTKQTNLTTKIKNMEKEEAEIHKKNHGSWIGTAYPDNQ